jgi:hypothetical protein
VVAEAVAPDGSGVGDFVVVGWLCFGRVPNVKGVSDECVELEVVPEVPLEQEEPEQLRSA